MIRGRMLTLVIREDADGTSNDTVYTMTVPFSSGDYPSGNYRFINGAQARDNSANSPAMIRIVENSASMSAYTSFAEVGWTNSGGKRIAGGVLEYCIDNIV
jgi:hypothetical protein